jgi:predicted Zn-dependent protease
MLHCRLEAEADYIGIMLLAAAGYDPQVAVQVSDKFADMERNKDYLWWRYDDCYSTHPSSKVRSRLLSQHKVMGEALHLYREVTANQGQEKVSPEC